jgi:hypothetical protein
LVQGRESSGRRYPIGESPGIKNRCSGRTNHGWLVQRGIPDLDGIRRKLDPGEPTLVDPGSYSDGDEVRAFIREHLSPELLAEMDRLEYYSTSMSFRMIESNDRSKLVKYILDEQRRETCL